MLSENRTIGVSSVILQDTIYHGVIVPYIILFLFNLMLSVKFNILLCIYQQSRKNLKIKVGPTRIEVYQSCIAKER